MVAAATQEGRRYSEKSSILWHFGCHRPICAEIEGSAFDRIVTQVVCWTLPMSPIYFTTPRYLLSVEVPTAHAFCNVEVGIHPSRSAHNYVSMFNACA